MPRIPYYIKRILPAYDIRNHNIITIANHSAEKNELTNDIIEFIIEDIYDCCSTEYSPNITHLNLEEYIGKWSDIYRVYYFEDNYWLEWKLEENIQHIYSRYVERFLQ